MVLYNPTEFRTEIATDLFTNYIYCFFFNRMYNFGCNNGNYYYVYICLFLWDGTTHYV